MEKQSLRNLRQKDFSKSGNGIVACCVACKKRFSTKDMVWNAIRCYYQAAKTEYPKYFEGLELEFPLSKERLDLFALRFPYDMVHLHNNNSALKRFIQCLAHLRFNEHDWKHRPGCFKKGCECRFDYPRWVQESFDLIFGNEESLAKWFTVYGSGDSPYLNAQGFTLATKRDVSDVFLNTHNRAVTSLLGYNNNVASGGRDMIYYVTLYNTKTNQKEERFPFFKQCVAIAKRIKRINLEEGRIRSSIQMTDTDTMNETVDLSHGKGLGHVLSGICAHLEHLHPYVYLPV
jgi:hypothetical protein